MGIRIFFKIRKIKKKRRKAVRKIEDAVKAFLYLNRALVKAGLPRHVRRRLRRDLINSNKPEDILLRFLSEIKRVERIETLDSEKDQSEEENDKV